MLIKGNTKLGDIWNWSLPEGDTCPGKTILCGLRCYARHGAYRFRSVKAIHDRNWKLAKDRHFVSAMTLFIQTKQIATVRIHASGDFDTVAYTKRWGMIIDNCPDTQFFAYTRSWRPTAVTPKGLVEAVKALTERPNMRLWLSADRETGRPPKWRRSPWAYLMIDDQDIPDYPVQLAFRDKPQTTMISAENVAQICPYEMHIQVKTEATEKRKKSMVVCSKCRICFDDARPVLRDFNASRRRKVSVA